METKEIKELIKELFMDIELIKMEYECYMICPNFPIFMCNQCHITINDYSPGKVKHNHYYNFRGMTLCPDCFDKLKNEIRTVDTERYKITDKDLFQI